jgi:hypothetical protein
MVFSKLEGNAKLIRETKENFDKENKNKFEANKLSATKVKTVS